MRGSWEVVRFSWWRVGDGMGRGRVRGGDTEWVEKAVWVSVSMLQLLELLLLF